MSADKPHSIIMMGDEKHGEVRRAWDACREVPLIQDEQKPRKRFQFVQRFCCAVVGLLVFILAVCSKSSFLLLVTLGNNATVTVPTSQKPSALLSIGCTLVGPSVLLLIKSLWKFIFKSSVIPSKKTVLWVVSIEFLVAIGTVLLTVVAMPHFDIVTNIMLLNSVSVLSAVLQVAADCLAKERKRFIMLPIIAIVLIILGYVLFILSFLLVENSTSEVVTAVALAILGTFFVSLNWWENYSTLFNVGFLNNISKDIAGSRNMVCILSSVVRILITGTVVGAYVPLYGYDWYTISSLPSDVGDIILGLVVIQVISSAMCHWFVVVACKIHALRRSFVVPMYLASVTVLAFFLVPVSIYSHGATELPANVSYCQSLQLPGYEGFNTTWFEGLMKDVTRTLCNREIIAEKNVTGLAFLGSLALCWWLGLIFSTLYIWYLRIKRIERTQDLFVRRMYESAFLEQSMLLNTRFEIRKRIKERWSKEPVTVYLCATMWHETYDEMMKMIISMFRLDKYRPRRTAASDAIFEFHIYFDDAFKDVEDSKERHVNEYAQTLVEVIREVYITFSCEDPCIFKKCPPLPNQKIIRTPYGGRLEYTLPKGNVLMVHFKDKKRIRHKKRWSQIMYLYYLLGWRLNRKFFKMSEEGGDKNALNEALRKEKENTYILALDGDTDFQPSALMLLIDRLKLYPDVGAACGRIHPTGTGPMVWYQKFEYAVGHWMQKTAEHVFGCVLCSPGCFSLFRGAALMDDNVMKRYTTKATEASHYVQYDQGEDRWLCTLLLKQGWRVEYNAAADAYTNAPEEFKEFYNQRRRWGPSTLANTIDLLGSGKMTSERNSSISRLYILYQIVGTGASILGPATICLMIAGSFNFIFNIQPNTALLLATLPPIVYLGLCFKLKADKQIKIAGVMSILYAFLMTATILSIIGNMVEEQTFMTPAGLFFISMILIYVVTAALHPQEFSLVIYGFLYFLCIPSGYLLLTIYSMVNMNNVTWGTRETSGQAKAQTADAIKKQLMQVRCCNCPCWGTARLVTESEPEVEIMTETEEKNYRIHCDSSKEERLKEFLSAERPPQIPFTLSQDETKFWQELQKKYLEPLVEDREQQEKMARDLKALRDKVTLVFFICNALWLVATFFLQAIGNAVSIPIPKIYANGTVVRGETISIDPIGLMFLLGFATLMVVQFLAMLYHRIYTLIHFVSYIATETKAAKKHEKKLSGQSAESDTQVSTALEAIYKSETMGQETTMYFQNPLAMRDSVTLVLLLAPSAPPPSDQGYGSSHLCPGSLLNGHCHPPGSFQVLISVAWSPRQVSLWGNKVYLKRNLNLSTHLYFSTVVRHLSGEARKLVLNLPPHDQTLEKAFEELRAEYSDTQGSLDPLADFCECSQRSGESVCSYAIPLGAALWAVEEIQKGGRPFPDGESKLIWQFLKAY
ncbi:chitin synthase chs-1-like [Chanos chanos]|uniref:chitin synthase n=1 Tax=Chanos chanos TaxID=29144 RepID=A0A6J2WQ00_CHACN|nr:chitin synthase chs-1-like [Chanos chanos]